MRRVLVLGTLLALGAEHTISAQRASPRFGLIAGVNRATLVGSNTQGLSDRTGFMGGGLLAFPVGGGFAIQAEAAFAMKGAESNSTGVGASAKMNYLEFPLLLRFDVPASGGVKPFVVAGPAVALQLSCDLEATGNGATVSYTCLEFNRQFGTQHVTFYTLDVGAMVGGGLAFDVEGRMLTVGVRYNWGLGKISSEEDTKNRVLSFVLTFEWPFHHGAR